MKVEARVLKEALNFLGLAISKDSTDRPTTKMVELSSIDGILYGYTCDGVNNIQYNICPTTEEVKAVVSYSNLLDIIKSCEGTIELKATDKFLSIKSDVMKCKISVYNTKIPKPEIKDLNDIDFSEVVDIIPICKSILNTSFTIECYRYVYFGDSIMMTDTDNVAIVKKKIFKEDYLLKYSSVQLLSKLEKCKYGYNEHVTKLAVSSASASYIDIKVGDKAIISILPMIPDKYQYNELNELFKLNIANSVLITKESLYKAIAASRLFNSDPHLVLDENGVSLQIASSEFVYKINSISCTKHAYKLNDEILKKLLSLGSDFTLFYDEKNLIKCVTEDVEEILSVEEVI